MLERSILIGQITKAAETLRQLDEKQYPHVMQVMYFRELKESKDKTHQPTLIDDFKARNDLSAAEKFLEPVLELKKTLDKINLDLVAEIKAGKRENDADGNLKYLLEHFSLEDLTDSELSNLEQNLRLIDKCFQSNELINQSLGIIIYQISSLIGIIASKKTKPSKDEEDDHLKPVASAPINLKMAAHLKKISALYAIEQNRTLYDLFKQFLDAKDFDQALLAITRLGEYLQRLTKDEANKLSNIPFGSLNLLTPKHQAFLAQMKPITTISFSEHDEIDPVQISFELGLSKIFDLCEGDFTLKSMANDAKISEQTKNKFLKLMKESSARHEYEAKILNPIEKLFYKIIGYKDNIGGMILGMIQLGEFCQQILPRQSIKEILSQIFQCRGSFSAFHANTLEYLIAIEAAIAKEPKSPHKALLEAGTNLFRGVAEKNAAAIYKPILRKDLEQQASYFIKNKLIPFSKERLEIDAKIKNIEKFAHNDEDDILYYADQVRLSSDDYYSSSSDVIKKREILEKKLISAQEQIDIRDKKKIAENIKEKISSIRMQQFSFSFLRALKRTEVTGFFAISDSLREKKFDELAKKSKEQKIDIDYSKFPTLIDESQVQQFFENLSELNQLLARYCAMSSLTEDDILSEDDRLAILIELIPPDDIISLLKKAELLYEAICKGGSTFLNNENILFSFILALRSKVSDHRSLKNILEQKQYEEINYLQEIYAIALHINQSSDLKSTERDKLVNQISEIKKLALKRRSENKAILKELKIVHSILARTDPKEIPKWLDDVELIESLLKKNVLANHENLALLGACEQLPKHKKPSDDFIAKEFPEEKTLERKIVASEDLKLTLNDHEQKQLSAISAISNFHYRIQHNIKSEQHQIFFNLVSNAVNARTIEAFLDAIYKLREQKQTEEFHFEYFQTLSADVVIFIKQIRYVFEKDETRQYTKLYEQLTEGLEIFETLVNLQQFSFSRAPNNLQFIKDINTWAQGKSFYKDTEASRESKQIHTASTASESPPSHSSLTVITSISQSSSSPSPTSEEKHSFTSHRSLSSPTLSSASRNHSKAIVTAPLTAPQPNFFNKAKLYMTQNPGKTLLYGLLGIAFIALCIVSGGTSLAATLGGMAFLAALKTGASMLLINYVLAVTFLGGAALGVGAKCAWESMRMSNADYYAALQGTREDIASQQCTDAQREPVVKRTQSQSYSGPLRRMINSDHVARGSTSVVPTAEQQPEGTNSETQEKEAVQINPIVQPVTRTLSH